MSPYTLSLRSGLNALVLTALPLLGACSTPKAEQPQPTGAVPTAAPVEAAPVETAPEPATPSSDATASPERIEEVSFNASDLGPRDDQGMQKLCLDCRVRKATYTYCLFDAATLTASLGQENMAKTITAKVELTAKASENYVPSDPNAPQPSGGFTHNTFQCRVLEVLASE